MPARALKTDINNNLEELGRHLDELGKEPMQTQIGEIFFCSTVVLDADTLNTLKKLKQDIADEVEAGGNKSHLIILEHFNRFLREVQKIAITDRDLQKALQDLHHLYHYEHQKGRLPTTLDKAAVLKEKWELEKFEMLRPKITTLANSLKTSLLESTSPVRSPVLKASLSAVLGALTGFVVFGALGFGATFFFGGVGAIPAAIIGAKIGFLVGSGFAIGRAIETCLATHKKSAEFAENQTTLFNTYKNTLFNENNYNKGTSNIPAKASEPPRRNQV